MTLNRETNVIDGAKEAVMDFMYQPQAASFKNVLFYASGSKMKRKSIGNVCGEVFTFKDEAPYKYKRFIIETAENSKGKKIYSLPLFDFEGEMIPEPDFQRIWNERCK
ncbi:hypothetical protein [Providencia rettgeri]|uniref:hypothetical protein n=1 Tax=Providencia rettgeri TaxID=587 RepID=UPI001E36002F|nr:hypothetical protein [Providencia rettgeri]